MFLRNIGKLLRDYYTALSLFMDSNIQPSNLSFWVISIALNNKHAKQFSGAFVACVLNAIPLLERRPLPVSQTAGGPLAIPDRSELCSYT